MGPNWGNIRLTGITNNYLIKYNFNLFTKENPESQIWIGLKRNKDLPSKTENWAANKQNSESWALIQQKNPDKKRGKD